MVQILKSSQRGKANRSWLESYHTFSFADYHNPDWMDYGNLRVINEDFIAPSSGFPTHGHKDMEIITYVVEGALEHKDNMGNSAVMNPGEVQVMSAGKGVLHSEFNPLSDQTSHILQIWILPHTQRVNPRYDQKDYSQGYKNNMRVQVVSGNQEAQGPLYIHQDANLFVTKQSQSGQYSVDTDAKRRYWVQLVKGNINFQFNKDNFSLEPGDAIYWQQESKVEISWPQTAEFLFFDLPA